MFKVAPKKWQTWLAWKTQTFTYSMLMQLSDSLKLVKSAMFSATFSPDYMCRTTIIFGALKDTGLKSNNYCFSYINVFQNDVNVLSKLVLKMRVFWQKAQNFAYFEPYDFVQILPACGPNAYQIMYRETIDLQYQHFHD